LLETLGIPVLGWHTDHMPLFYRADGGPPVAARVDTTQDAARIAQFHWRLGRHSSVVLAQPPKESLDVDSLVDDAVRRAEQEGITGQDVTPFVLAHVHEASGGRTVRANKKIVVENAALAADVAVAYSKLT
jgi:pseudouridine-5'-phosphate glycosidase